jgi:23S rRNA maturation mini-RNase III
MNEKQDKRKEYMQAYLAHYRTSHREIKITFSNPDYAAIQRIAEKQGMKTAAYIRKVVHEQSKNLYLFPKDLEEQIQAAVRNIRGIGNNINQIARYCHGQKYSSSDTLEVIFNFLKKIEDEIKSLKLTITDKRKKHKIF